jgi:hypothetical protein
MAAYRSRSTIITITAMMSATEKFTERSMIPNATASATSSDEIRISLMRRYIEYAANHGVYSTAFARAPVAAVRDSKSSRMSLRASSPSILSSTSSTPVPRCQQVMLMAAAQHARTDRRCLRAAEEKDKHAAGIVR